MERTNGGKKDGEVYTYLKMRCYPLSEFALPHLTQLKIQRKEKRSALEAAEWCPRCRKHRLVEVVHTMGRSATCLCGYERIIERISPYELEQKHWQWKEGLSSTALRFRAVEALLQSVHEMQVCSACVEHAPVEDLRAQAMELEHLRSYLAQGDVYTDRKMDAYLVQVVSQLQGVGQLCEPCWQKILQATIRRFTGQF